MEHKLDISRQNGFFHTMETFVVYLDNILSYILSLHVSLNYEIWFNILVNIVKQTNDTRCTRVLSYCMEYYGTLINKENNGFKEFHSNLINSFFKNLIVEEHGKKLTKIENLYPIINSPRPKRNNVHIVVDGLNFFANIMKALKQKHQFETVDDIIESFDYAITFFNTSVISNSSIHFVIKPFGSDMIWQLFNTLFQRIFMNRKIPKIIHFYDLFIAVSSDRCDIECDDRLVVRLALSYNEISNNQVYVFSNDAYESISMHWENESHYKLTYSATQIHCLNKCLSLSDIYKLSIIGFEFHKIHENDKNKMLLWWLKC